jgi:molybdopterin-binding protein
VDASARRVARDLGNHFRDRVATVIEDSMDTSCRVDLPVGEVTTYITGHLVALAAVVAIGNGISRGDFLRGVADIYDRMTKAKPS